MMTKTTRMFRGMGLSALVLGTVPAVAPAQEALPDAWTLIEHHIAAIGGKERIAEQEGQRAVGTFQVPAQGITGDLEIFAAAPNKLFVRTVVPGIGTVMAGYDGEIAWNIHPALGPRLLQGLELHQMREQADLRAPLHMDRYVASAETVEQTEFDGRACYKVKIVTPWEEEYHQFYDAETGLLAGTIRQQGSPMGAIEVTTVLADYESIDGLRVPTRTVQSLMGMQQVLTLTELEAGAVPDSVFALPTAIEALVEGNDR